MLTVRNYIRLIQQAESQNAGAPKYQTLFHVNDFLSIYNNRNLVIVLYQKLLRRTPNDTEVHNRVKAIELGGPLLGPFMCIASVALSLEAKQYHSEVKGIFPLAYLLRFSFTQRILKILMAIKYTSLNQVKIAQQMHLEPLIHQQAENINTITGEIYNLKKLLNVTQNTFYHNFRFQLANQAGNKAMEQAREAYEEQLAKTPVAAQADETMKLLDINSFSASWIKRCLSHGNVVAYEENQVVSTEYREMGAEIIDSNLPEQLKMVENESLSSVSAFHLANLYALAVVIEIIDEIYRALLPKGLFIMELGPNQTMQSFPELTGANMTLVLYHTLLLQGFGAVEIYPVASDGKIQGALDISKLNRKTETQIDIAGYQILARK